LTIVTAQRRKDENEIATEVSAKMANPNDGFILDTNPVGKTGWEATALANAATQNMTVYVICAQAATTTP
jgi:streptomycin 6-kinase